MTKQIRSLDELMAFKLDATTRQAVEDQAARQHVTMSEIIRQALQAHLSPCPTSAEASNGN